MGYCLGGLLFKDWHTFGYLWVQTDGHCLARVEFGMYAPR